VLTVYLLKMKKITIINGEYHEEEMDSPSPKVVENHNIPPYPGTDGTSGVLMFGTGGEMSRFDLDEFRRMWYEPYNHFERERESDERLRNLFREAMPTPERTITQIWEESGPFPTARLPITGNIISSDDSVTSLAAALVGSTASSAMAGITNNYNGTSFPLSNLTSGINLVARNNDATSFAILKRRRSGYSYTMQRNMIERMYENLPNFLTENPE